MEFTLQKISNQGAENPIVARLSIQTDELVESFFLSKNKQDAICDIFALKIQSRLLRCFEIMTEIESAYKECQRIPDSELISNGVIQCPSIIDLNSRIENFLHEAKSILREVIRIINYFYPTNFTEPRFDEACKWARKEFGESDELTKFLRHHHDAWIRKLQEMRDSITHPYSTGSKKLAIENITIKQNFGHLVIVAPCWCKEGELPTPIIDDMKEYTNCLLTFCEELLVQLLRKTPPGVYVKIAEIQESSREAKCPVRFWPSYEKFPNEAEMKIISEYTNHAT